MEKKWTPEFLSEIEKWVEDNDTNFVAAAKHFKVSLGSIYSNRMKFNKTDKKRKYTKARKPDLVFTAPPAVATVNNDKVVIVIANRSNISQVLTELWR